MTILWPGEEDPDEVCQRLLEALRFCWDAHDSSMARWVGLDGYVQWAGWPEGVQIECSGSPFMGEPPSPRARNLLAALSFQPPDEAIPNYWRRITAWDELPAAASALTACLFEISLDEEPHDRAWQTAGDDQAKPIVTIAPVGKVGTEAVAKVAAATACLLAETAPVAVVDAYSWSGAEPSLPSVFARRQFAELDQEAAPQNGAKDHLLISGLQDEGPTAELESAALVTRTVRRLRASGWTVLLIGPPVFEHQHWTYEHGALPLTDALLMLRHLLPGEHRDADRSSDFLLQATAMWSVTPLVVDVDYGDASKVHDHNDEQLRLTAGSMAGLDMPGGWLHRWLLAVAPG